ncbi:hypothetical protein QYF36_019200 [Acer negundo]|nr:hypothetical protein QYF36_019200 [Acer negundo]
MRTIFVKRKLKWIGCFNLMVSSFYGVLTGKRIASTLGTRLPLTMIWMSIPYKDYRCHCRKSILASM